MKKYSIKISAFSALTAVALFFTGCQKDDKVILTTDFESVVLPSEGYLGAENANGAHLIDNVSFLAVYNAEYGISSGVIISNLTDTVTPGYLNSYSAFPGSGAEGSSKFAIINPPFGSTEPMITFTEEVAVESVDMANNTYAALSMRNGDAFAKAFTAEDEDFFVVIFEGFDAGGNSTGTIEAYLADFRPGSNTGILSTWKNLNLSGLGMVKSIGVSFNSSDIGTYGINTPLYVAIDNLRFEE